jgi:hypothetical protein
MRRYKVVYGGAEWDAKVGDVVPLELSQEEEADLTAPTPSRVEIVPVTYEATSTAQVFGNKLGKRFEMALPLAVEAALLAGGHIAVVESVPKGAK